MANDVSALAIRLADGKAFSAAPDQTLLDAAQAAGLQLPHSCRTGRCGSCKARCRGGTVRHLRGDDVLTPAERAAGWALTCTDAAEAPLSLDVEDQADLAGLPLLTLPARVAAAARPTPELLHLHLRLPPGQALRFRPGQFLELIGPDGLRRAYSLANAPAAAQLELFVRRVPGGAMSDFLFERLVPQALLRLQGPHGSFRLREVAGQRLLWLATGTGIAPFKAMAEHLAAQPRAAWPQAIDCYWGQREAAEFALWAPPPALLPPLRLHPVVSRGAFAGLRGHVQAHAFAGPRPDQVFACGNPGMIDAARAHCLALGLPPRAFHADAFVPSH